MSHSFLDADMLHCSEDNAEYLTIEAYDIADYTEALIKYSQGFKIANSNDLYPRYFPPRYMVTLVKDKAAEVKVKKSKN